MSLRGMSYERLWALDQSRAGGSVVMGYPLDGGFAVDDGDVRRWREGEVGGGDRKVLLDSREGELGDGAVDLFDLHAFNNAGRRDHQGEQADALGHAFGHAGDGEVGAAGSGGNPVELLGELGAAEQEAEGRAEVVELAGGRAHDLGVAGGVEPAVVAVEDEDFAGRLVVAPAHEAGFPEQEGAGFGAVKAHAGVVLGVAGAEGAEVVVVVVDPADEGGVGLCVEERGAEQREQQGDGERNAGILHCVQNDSKSRLRQGRKQIPPLRSTPASKDRSPGAPDCGMTNKKQRYGRGWVQLVPPLGSDLTTPSWSEQ